MADSTTIAEYKCPNCGSTERMVDHAHREQETNTAHKKEKVYFHTRELIPLIPAQQAILTVPCLVVFRDYCIACGVFYTFRADTLNAPIQFMDKGQMPDTRNN